MMTDDDIKEARSVIEVAPATIEYEYVDNGCTQQGYDQVTYASAHAYDKMRLVIPALLAEIEAMRPVCETALVRDDTAKVHAKHCVTCEGYNQCHPLSQARGLAYNAHRDATDAYRAWLSDRTKEPSR